MLRGERELIGLVRAVPSPPREQEMGGAVEVLAVALGSGGVGTVLARSVLAWLQTRRSSVVVTVETDKATVKVDARILGSGDALEVLQRALNDVNAGPGRLRALPRDSDRHRDL